MKKKIVAMGLLGAMLVTQVVPQMKAGARQLQEEEILQEELEEEKVSNEEESIETFMYDVDAELIKAEEDYIDRFIVKYTADTQQKNTSQLTVAAEKAFSEAKISKEKIEAEYVEKRMEAPDGEAELVRSKGLVDVTVEKNISDIHVTDMCKQETQYQVIELSESIDPEIFLEEMEGLLTEGIEYIQPDYIMELASEEIISDVEDESDSSPENKGEVEEGTEVQDERIPVQEPGLQEAWEISTGAGITVAVIDTGVDTAHPMLADHIVDGYDFYNDKTDVYDKSLGMEQAHGTHVSGIIAQTAPDTKIMPLKVFENGRAYTSDIIKAIEYAEEKGADSVNMSFGCSLFNIALKETMEQSGMFFVCAAGNGRKDIDVDAVYPASFGLANSISVASLNNDGGMSFFSNYGAIHTDIAACGREIYSSWPDGAYGTMTGTSMSEIRLQYFLTKNKKYYLQVNHAYGVDSDSYCFYIETPLTVTVE